MPAIKCTNCGLSLAPQEGSERLSCPRCHATARTVEQELTAEVKFSAGLKGIAYSGDSKTKWFVKLLSEPVWQYTRKIWAHRFKMKDKKNDRYIESVVHSDTGEVLHASDEKLTSHVGHGSPKKSTKVERDA